MHFGSNPRIQLQIHESSFESTNPVLNPPIQFRIHQSSFESTNAVLNPRIPFEYTWIRESRTPQMGVSDPSHGELVNRRQYVSVYAYRACPAVMHANTVRIFPPIYKRSKKVIVAFFLLLMLSWLLTSMSGATPTECLNVVASRMTDHLRRERYFHGLNVVVKKFPWLPRTDQFDPKWSFVEKDMEAFQSLGLNAIRRACLEQGGGRVRTSRRLACIPTLFSQTGHDVARSPTPERQVQRNLFPSSQADCGQVGRGRIAQWLAGKS